MKAKQISLPIIILLLLLPIRFISQNPIKLNYFTKSIETYAADLGYNISIDNIELGFNPELLKPVVTLYNIKLYNLENQNNTLEKAEAGLDLSQIFSFRPRFMIDLNLKDLSLDIDEIITYPQHNDSLASIKDLYDILNFKLKNIPISSISFDNLSFKYKGISSKISSLDLTIKPEMSLVIHDANNLKALELKIESSDNGVLVASGTIYDSSNISLYASENSETVELSWEIDQIDLKNLLLV